MSNFTPTTWSYLVCAIVAAVLGFLFIGVGLRRAVAHEPSSDAFKFKRKKSVSFGGAPALPAMGIGLLAVAALFFFNGVLPVLQASSTEPAPALSPTPSASVSPRPPAPPRYTNPAKVLIKTPRGTVCSTYLDADAIGCVITDHSWGNQGCQYLFTLTVKGKAAIEDCPAPSTLIRLYAFPGKTVKPTEYGSTVHLGTISCQLTSDWLRCTNPQNESFQVSTEHHTP